MSLIPFSRDRGINQSIVPHRSLRNLPVNRKALYSAIPGVIVVELAVVFLAQRALDAMSAVAVYVARYEGIRVRPF